MSAMGRFLGLLLAFWLAAAGAGAGQGGEGAQGPEVPVYLFWSASCPTVWRPRPQIQALAAAHPWIVLHDLGARRRPGHGERYETMAAELGEALAVPALFLRPHGGRLGCRGRSAARLLEALEGVPRRTAPPVPPRRCAPALLGRWTPPACRCRC